jgi:hypothetical protein
VVVVYRAFNERSGRRYSVGIGEGIVTADLIHWSWYLPFGLLTPASWVAMFTQRYMHETVARHDPRRSRSPRASR